MGRTFDAQSLVSLPRLGGAGAAALGRQMITAARGRKLSKPIAAKLKKLETAVEGVEKSLSSQPAPVVTADARAADAAEDNALSAISDFLSSWARLPQSVPEAKKARDAHAALFPSGLKFTQLPYKQEWAEADALLRVMRASGADTAIKSLGGAAFLANLHSVHEAYGKALGITAQKAPPPAAVSVREPLDAFSSAARGYALQVAASVDEDDPKSEELAAALLEPLMSWESKQSPSANSPAQPQANAAPAAIDPAAPK